MFAITLNDIKDLDNSTFVDESGMCLGCTVEGFLAKIQPYYWLLIIALIIYFYKKKNKTALFSTIVTGIIIGTVITVLQLLL